MLVQDLMTVDVVSLHPGSTATELLDLLHERDIRHVPIVDDDGSLLGLVTHRDVLRYALGSDQTDLPPNLREQILQERTVDGMMTTGVLTVDPDQDLATAAQLMLENKLGCLPVVEGTRLVGILTEADFVRRAVGGD